MIWLTILPSKTMGVGPSDIHSQSWVIGVSRKNTANVFPFHVLIWKLVLL